MEKREWILVGIVFIFILLLALWQDLGSQELVDGSLERAEVGQEEKRVNLILEAEGIFSEKSFQIEVKPQKLSQEEVKACIEDAITQIEEDFNNRGDEIPLKESYEEGKVEAIWNFIPYGYIDRQGKIASDKLPENGIVIEAKVRLLCGDEERIYQFPVELKPVKKTPEEELMQDISQYLAEEMEKSGSERILLPQEMSGIKLHWREEKEGLFLKVVLLEMVAILLLIFGNKKQKEKEALKKRKDLEEAYPDIINQLVVLLGAGMTPFQAWQRISKQYEEKRRMNLIPSQEVYEEIRRMCRHIQEGESERRVYEKFGEKLGVLCYRRLIGLLLNAMEKGTKDLSMLLENESRQAYELRIANAKQKGEEASTKLLLPLMIMMIFTMGVVLLPAILRFT